MIVATVTKTVKTKLYLNEKQLNDIFEEYHFEALEEEGDDISLEDFIEREYEELKDPGGMWEGVLEDFDEKYKFDISIGKE